MKKLFSWVLVLIGFSVQPALAQQTHLLVIVGLGGDPTFTEQFHGWAASLIDVATDRYGIPAENLNYLGEYRIVVEIV